MTEYPGATWKTTWMRDAQLTLTSFPIGKLRFNHAATLHKILHNTNCYDVDNTTAKHGMTCDLSTVYTKNI